MNFLSNRLRRDTFSGLPLTVLIVVSGFLVALFLGIAENVVAVAPLVSTDNAVAHFFASHRTPCLNQFFLADTFLGGWVSVVLVGIIFSAFLYFRHRRTYLLPFISTVVGSSLTVSLIKIIIGRDRPGLDIAYYVEKSLSFPSGHAAVSAAVYGYIAYVFVSNTTHRFARISIISFATLLVGAISISRLYLGVHYLTDVVAGCVVGLVWLILGIILTEVVWRDL